MKQHDLKAQVKALGIDSLLPPVQPTEAQSRALIDLKRGNFEIGVQSRTGGAIWRMLKRMKELGWVTEAPFRLTNAGRSKAVECEQRETERQNRWLRRAGLR